MSKFFINRPIVAMVIAIIMVIIGVVAMVQLPIAQYPDLAPPEILVTATLCRRRFPNSRTISRHADRAANAGRRQNALYEFGQRQYRSHEAAGHFRRGHRS